MCAWAEGTAARRASAARAFVVIVVAVMVGGFSLRSLLVSIGS